MFIKHINYNYTTNRHVRLKYRILYSPNGILRDVVKKVHISTPTLCRIFSSINNFEIKTNPRRFTENQVDYKINYTAIKSIRNLESNSLINIYETLRNKAKLAYNSL